VPKKLGLLQEVEEDEDEEQTDLNEFGEAVRRNATRPTTSSRDREI
jgi:hypothetical protein